MHRGRRVHFVLMQFSYLGLFGDLAWIIWGYFPTSWNFLGNHDDNNRSGDTARYAGGGTKSVSIIIDPRLSSVFWLLVVSGLN